MRTGQSKQIPMAKCSCSLTCSRQVEQVTGTSQVVGATPELGDFRGHLLEHGFVGLSYQPASKSPPLESF